MHFLLQSPEEEGSLKFPGENKIVHRGVVRLLPKPRVSIFICGCGHTGSTLLARILAAHPDVFAIRRETSAFVSNSGARWTKLSLVLLQAAISRRSVWVEKTPNHIHYTRQITETIPGARFIVVTRDGRDVVASLGQRYEGDFDKAFQRWIADSKASMLRVEKGESILWRYEDFIESPALSIERLCRFIGVAFDPGILNYHEQPVVWGREKVVRTAHSARRHAQVNQPITDYRGGWRSRLPTEVACRFDAGEAREIMDYFGYAQAEHSGDVNHQT
ncbi:sulfotransferase [Mesorhizobium sp. B3-1-6]|uniref:sulfotransferase family protein n=1 Tax=Mesorhizobium sp. B3-1-6 TaxID=2589895 RepID=UPI0011289F0E|nr:sulfotransferase [Mesorhizobium sp. B3-1-6]TPI37415.1 sulfotransferase [Mesorhizobium sp. B3-1-6]